MIKNYMIKILLVGLLFSFPIPYLEAKNNDKQAQLNNAYLAYQKHQQEFGNTAESKNFAKAAYIAGQAALDKKSIEYAILTENYGVALNIPHPNKESIPYLIEAVEIYQSLDEPSEGLVNTLLELSKVYKLNSKTRKKANSTQRKAVKYAEEVGDQVLLIKTLLNAGSNNIAHYRPSKKEVTRGVAYLETALELLDPKYVETTALIEFWLGKGNSLLKRNKKSINYFEQVLTKKEHSKSIHQLAMSSHAFLVDAYSRTNEHEKATEHCQAIGKTTPWNDNQESEPLYIKPPKYPRTAAMNGREGWVKVSFTVTPDGFVENPEVVKNSSKIFINTALEAIKDWRFAPKFVDGKPVAAPSIYTMEFKLAKK